jgi:hypothetical protein
LITKTIRRTADISAQLKVKVTGAQASSLAIGVMAESFRWLRVVNGFTSLVGGQQARTLALQSLRISNPFAWQNHATLNHLVGGLHQ